MRVRKPTADLPPTAPPHTEPLTLPKLRRLAEGVNDLAERIEAVGLTEGTRDDVDRIRLTACHYLRWGGLRDESAPPWAGYARDLLAKMLSPLNWCYASDGGKHTAAEIVAALRRLSACMAKVAGGDRKSPLALAKIACVQKNTSDPRSDSRVMAIVERVQEWLADSNVRTYWLRQIEAGGDDTRWAGGRRLSWPADRPAIYGILAMIGQEYSRIEIVPDELRASPWWNANRNWHWVSSEGQGRQLLAYVEKDIAERLLVCDGPAGEPAEATTGDDRTGTRQKRPKKRTRRSKRPAEVLKEARERHAAKILAQRPGITSRELGQELDCDASTVTRLKAWANRGVNDHPKPPKGFGVKRDADEGGSDIDAID